MESNVFEFSVYVSQLRFIQCLIVWKYRRFFLQYTMKKRVVDIQW